MALERLAPEPKVSVFEPDTPSTPDTPAPGAPRLSLNLGSPHGLLSPSFFEQDRQPRSRHLSPTSLSPQSPRSPSSPARLEPDSEANRWITLPSEEDRKARNQKPVVLLPSQHWSRRSRFHERSQSEPYSLEPAQLSRHQ
ncbi:hypothetical protein JCM11641_000206 [Rhodosporidiobolus odoratus]